MDFLCRAVDDDDEKVGTPTLSGFGQISTNHILLICFRAYNSMYLVRSARHYMWRLAGSNMFLKTDYIYL